MSINLNINDVIIKPVITEKSSLMMTEINAYTFEVHKEATKTDIKEAIEFIFKPSHAKVEKIRIQNIRKKYKKMGKFDGMTRGWKKAIVYLSEGTIPVFGNDGIEDTSKKTREIINVDKLMEQAEQEGNK